MKTAMFVTAIFVCICSFGRAGVGESLPAKTSPANLWELELVTDSQKPEPIPLHKKPVIGNQAYCVIGPKEVECIAKIMNFCLYVANQTPDAISCETIKDFKRMRRESAAKKHH